ncbi:DUF2333 family protein [Pseudomonas psychrophila]|jgi:hypothetical protein|uniref:DUF2333 family protein n=1 Tax=Pseudomonas psychrophila TaxID=122355 RepID=A0ABY0VBL7_9PSED|nr:DUF2333 family protein [Pseudomonas psychrophila]EPJ93748.1 hypothetical protein CF149_11315 [Pseudomonas psychrophila]KAB0489212.1 DUF2333 family protein [Pseudomonas psychrophila]KMM98152.1 hypothetical protein TU76_17255 [Pseudomonas psychrophila]KOX63409.1 hypothetical protein AA303_19515 [Pseudomonas psychrophila]QIE30764.1 DUF2333 family protein [Pseudomonas psychrophila]
MLDWKKREGSARESVKETKTQSRGYFKSILLSRSIAVLVAIFIVVNLGVGWYWSQEPDLFPVQQNAQMAAEKEGKQMVPGFTTVETLKTVAGTLLSKSGGYLSNDRLPPGIFLDNIPSWEYGVLVQVRDLTRALRKDFARSQSQSAEDADLAKAEPRFNFDNKSWMLPSSESEYQEGINSLSRYQARLSDPNQKNALFYARADNLNNWLGDVGTRLGSLSQRLSASVGRVKLNSALKTESLQPGQVPVVDEEVVETPWMQIDNVFYEARGQAWALSHLLRAIEVDFADVLAKKNATVSVRQIIRELEAAQEPVWSPMILNGSGYGVLANHSLVMANYISRANAAVMDLRQLLSQG